MEEKKTGLFGLDYSLLSTQRGELMGLAMLWVMLFHAFYLTPRTETVAWLKDIGYCGVDIFIFLSALGLAMSLTKRPQSYGQYLKRRLVRILPTYWLVTGIYGLILRLAGRTTLKTVFWTVSTLFYWLEKPNYFNWYIPGLLFFYLIAPPVTALLRRCRWRTPLTLALCLGCYPLFSLAQAHGLAHLGDTVLRFPVFLLGTLMGLYLAQGVVLTLPRLIFWAALPALIPVIPKVFCLDYFPVVHIFSLCAVIVCLALGRVLALLPGRGPRQALRALGECSLEIYLLNVIFVLEYPWLSGFIPIGERHSTYYAITILANILLGVGLHKLLRRPQTWLTGKLTG